MRAPDVRLGKTKFQETQTVRAARTYTRIFVYQRAHMREREREDIRVHLRAPDEINMQDRRMN